MKLNLNLSSYKGTTKLKEWWKAVKSHFEAVQTAHNALEDEVAAEKTRLSTEINQRTTADIALSNRINQEVQFRNDDFYELHEYVDSEISELRKEPKIKTVTYTGVYPYFDTKMNEKYFWLINEGGTSDRLFVNDEIGYKLSEPIAAADTRLCIMTKGCVTGADTEWGFIYVIPKSDRIGAEETARAAADNTLDGKVTEEQNARIAADTVINKQIDNILKKNNANAENIASLQNTVSDNAENISNLYQEVIGTSYDVEALKNDNPLKFVGLAVPGGMSIVNMTDQYQKLEETGTFIVYSNLKDGTDASSILYNDDVGYDFSTPLKHGYAYLCKITEEPISTVDVWANGTIAVIGIADMYEQITTIQSTLGTLSSELDAVNGAEG